jgi:heme/copper-type cytochrome/quinol oxidase subunit 3
MRVVQTASEIPRGTVSNAAFGMALFVFVEVMLFAGFISAFGIVRANALPGAWPPPGQPRLPVARTALNTVALLLSGGALFVAGRRFRGPRPESARGWMAAAFALGAFFVVAQGAEWAALLRQGLTLSSSELGSFFYTIVGAHALHAVVALVVLALVWRSMREGQLTESRFGAARIFWYFVVLVWPLLYWRVYL